MKKLIIVSFFLLGMITVSAQKSVNNFKYVIVPNQFEFQDEPGQYQINGLTKFLFEKYGFEAYLEGEVPEELLNRPCDGLKTNILNESGMLTTKVKVTLVDCRNNVVFESEEGKSKEKEYSKSFNLATRDAFKDIEALHYSYEPLESDVAAVESTTKMKKPKVEKEVVELQKKSEEVVVKDEKSAKIEEGVLLAKSFGGVNYKIYNAKEELVMTLLFTPSKDVYIVKDEDAIVYKNEEGVWIHFVSDGTSMTAKALTIKW
ncbi:hypothetical protein SAMN05216480_101664 [Pustulibacterium marinum]|uniref:Uncharacterized protein n=1 Tax=Pustulibacterium marinum TaxID=1224947 RepID=A0A1I7F5T5_9FLAO|nr:hypothetical protein [Pustulibacterium marinum]SFU31578.1 hypothetical protein SAMN05216480_101664 [Pustulibacterium marinum]